MSAEDLGTRELGQVRTQRLDELLNTLRLLHSPSANSKLGIPALDKLLTAHTPRFDPTNLSSTPAPPIIEITSPGPKSGKTELLYWIIANLVLGSGSRDADTIVEATRTDEQSKSDASEPACDAKDNHEEMLDDRTMTEHEATTDPNATAETPANLRTAQSDYLTNDTNTKNPPLQTSCAKTPPTAIALLTTFPISIPRLSQIILYNLLLQSPSIPLTKAQKHVHDTLNHIHIYSPTSLTSVIATLSTLPSYFLSPSNFSHSRRLGAIILDSASSFYWDDRLASSSSSTTSASTAGVGKYPALASMLKRVSTTLQTPVLFTTDHLSPLSITPTSESLTRSSGRMALKPQLPHPWPNLPCLHLIITRNQEIARFERDVDAQTAIKQAKTSDKAVLLAAKFEITVNGHGDEGWMAMTSGNEGFSVKIDGKGVEMVYSP
ncbi:hypothetical protein AUEXF2481DRAFT_42964 [Aureobasidium subglaciale EXF-2481]|uniref:DNA recombination and repair protein Rad51-like C-terminal domain-containing protein n=1 Tax=Aureobasidium subglaciale (strain EXF-2481) TaxID=1043005 RepID=A0A074Y3Z4_AURSE|nr:uncharacterized protein AUEXF2481DRAFT_42964 [Aureobasidium subglaciale EXF-2481]KAI5210807.1 hypothetical protein E4T38_01762 [Aureobasidium subglaciale]KAI5229408.1 hypothetical protein E4T40_01718 [Aureobasidium subglaciale]KAI5232946.1 hypothetical protein E4T41_01760 [Aureobasidium subglaciale]KAI5266419.1 hypothetical protein E4T46_01715 [Aureobasidium subglaciale]KEQ92518.1 hypothetical protein AUEXF2481DRAFT_42964 [Aureobasidium subglaciale EXF-2481]